MFFRASMREGPEIRIARRYERIGFFMSAKTLDRAAFYRRLDEILDIPAGTVKGGEVLSVFDGWDSMAMLGFIALADEHYSVTVPAKRIPACVTVDDLAGLIAEFSK
jgi:acyl carrier protein